MAKAINWHGEDYPAPDETRSGSKVGWYYYKSADDAQAASRIAKETAKRLEAQGYDWGFQVPGTINLMGESSKEYAGLYEVCVP